MKLARKLKRKKNNKSGKSSGKLTPFHKQRPEKILQRVVRLCQDDDYQGAENLLQKANTGSADNPQLLNTLGVVQKKQGRLSEALASFERAVTLWPDSAELHNNRGNTLKGLGRLAEAKGCFKRAIALMPDFSAAHCNLGNVLRQEGEYTAAVDCYRKALALKGDDAPMLNNLGLAYLEQGELTEAEASLQKALAIQPDYAEAYNNLANVFKEQGRINEALASYRRAVSLKPDFTRAQSNLLLCLNYDTHDRKKVFAEHQNWGKEKNPSPKAMSNKNYDTGKIRIGYVSADFRRHPVACFAEPVIAGHDRQNFEVFCYGNQVHEDGVTERFKRGSNWRNIFPLSDDDAAALIRDDNIDILIDLSGHTQGNRLQMFQLRPARVQATWLGYPNTTGLTTMDYRIGDGIVDLPGAEPYYSEQLVRLSRCFLCYAPPVPANAAPLQPKNGNKEIIFGSFNNLAKLSDGVIAAWSRILTLVPDSRLIVKYRSLADQQNYHRLLQRFAAHGLPSPETRIEIHSFMPGLAEHLALYNRLDIALDSFPYNGTTTTCEALWMGTPVVTLAGDRHAARVGASLLTTVGLAELVAEDIDAYVETAVGLADNRERLKLLATDLRKRMEQSPLMDSTAFCLELEKIYRSWIYDGNT
jgi:predicted O-linked N-acetylglucosamine transferase (SPINDLY family)